jgi:D12 class N6 adenine-specific DNA methyltransferase
VPALKAPFPWFGGKSRVAPEVWDRFGNVPNYVEPFFGSGAVLLGRPFTPTIETINDKDCFVANFWRALQHDSQGVSYHADNPVNEADLHARHLWLVNNQDFQERMKTDPLYYDSMVAGWWVWGQSQWIGGGWCTGRSSWGHEFADGEPCHERLPDISNAGKGIHRKRPHLGNAGKGIHRQLPHLGDAGMESLPIASDLILETPARASIASYLGELAERFRRVRVCCGDWTRILGPSPTVKLGLTGVFLDPPYSEDAGRAVELYASEDLQISRSVREWAIENGDNPLMRIALCGYEGEHQMPDSWECVRWKAMGGYGSQGNGAGRENSARERIWFSPHCLRLQENLFQSV